MNNEVRFKLFDHAPKRSTDVNGVAVIGDLDRDVVREFGIFEPLDRRIDQWVSAPARSSLQYGDPVFEIGPLSFGPAESVALYNALADHINNFRLGGRSS